MNLTNIYKQLKTKKMKIKLTTVEEFEVDITFPIYRKTNYSITKWINETSRITVFTDSISTTLYGTLTTTEFQDTAAKEQEFNDAYKIAIQSINDTYGLNNISEHPELNVSEG